MSDTGIRWRVTASDKGPDLEQFIRRTEAENAASRRQMQTAGALDWGGWLLRPSVLRRPFSAVNDAPGDSGVYVLWSVGDVAYIGLSISLVSRLVTHARNTKLLRFGDWDSYSFVRVPEYAIHAVEVAHIDALEPDWNDRFDVPTWTGHKAMVKTLLAEWEGIA